MILITEDSWAKCTDLVIGPRPRLLCRLLCRLARPGQRLPLLRLAVSHEQDASEATVAPKSENCKRFRDWLQDTGERMQGWKFLAGWHLADRI